MNVLARNDNHQVTSLEAPATLLNETELSIADLMQEPIDQLMKLALEHDVNLFYEPTKIKINLKVDRQKIQDAIIHVVQNAIKYSRPSSSLYVMTGRDFNGDFYVRVDDEGTGIAHDILEAMLEPFTKVENGIEPTQNQTGCGLSLVNAYLKMHFGYLRIQSQLGRGTSATLTLPKSCLRTR